MVYLVHVYEGLYQALHGIENYYISANPFLGDIEKEAEQESLELMESYDFIMEDLEASAEEREISVEEEMRENVMYTIYPVKEEFIDNMGGDLNASCDLAIILDEIGFDEFRDYYCDTAFIYDYYQMKKEGETI